METSDKFNKQETLCWYCANAVPNNKTGKGCSWSREFKPVEGWDAEETLVISRPDREVGECAIQSFIVKGCPCFDRDSTSVITQIPVGYKRR